MGFEKYESSLPAPRVGLAGYRQFLSLDYCIKPDRRGAGLGGGFEFGQGEFIRDILENYLNRQIHLNIIRRNTYYI